MRWPWQRRTTRSVAVVAAQPVRQVASWAQPAMPPRDAASLVPAEPPAPAPPLSAVAPLPAAAPPQPEAAVHHGGSERPVLLGFADGSQVALDEHDPSALALRAIADVLAQPRGTR